MLRIIVNCGPCEDFIARCIGSIRSQSFRDWQAYLTLDPCGDKTLEQAGKAREDDRRVHIHQNAERQFSMLNLIQAIDRSAAQPDDVIVVLDGDDWFAHPDALRTIHRTYKQFNCWMTYGSWVADQTELPGMCRGMWPAYPTETTDFRSCEWLGTAVRTWKRWLWDLIDDRDFRDGDGRYFRVTEDQAAMLPMLEMSGTERSRHIDQVLMVYNRSSPHACGQTRYEEMLANSRFLRSRPPYSRLIERPTSESALLSRSAVP